MVKIVLWAKYRDQSKLSDPFTDFIKHICYLLISCCCRPLTLAKRDRCVPLVDPLCSPRTGGTALANKTKALVTAETQGAAEFCACQTVHCAIYWAVWRAAVGSFDTKERKKERKDTGKDKTECNEDNKQSRANKMQLLKKRWQINVLSIVPDPFFIFYPRWRKGGYEFIQVLTCNFFLAKPPKTTWDKKNWLKKNIVLTKQKWSLSATPEEIRKSDGYKKAGTKWTLLFSVKIGSGDDHSSSQMVPTMESRFPKNWRLPGLNCIFAV